MSRQAENPKDANVAALRSLLRSISTILAAVFPAGAADSQTVFVDERAASNKGGVSYSTLVSYGAPMCE